MALLFPAAACDAIVPILGINNDEPLNDFDKAILSSGRKFGRES
jgi:hypothetical protein